MDMEMKNCVQAECTAFEMNRMLKDLRNVNFVSDISDKVDKLNKMAESLCVYVIDGGEVTDEAKDAIIGTFLLLHNKKRIPNRVAWELVNMEYYLAKMKESFEQQEKVVKVSPITLELVYERAIRDLDTIKIEKALNGILKGKLGAVIDGEYIEYSTGYNYKNKKKITEQIYVDLVQICNSPRNSKRGNNNLFLEIVKKWSENVMKKKVKQEIVLDERTKWEDKCFSKAIEKGLMEKDGDGYRWVFGGHRHKARLAYFLHKVYNPNGLSPIPYKRLQEMFGESRLDRAVDQAINTKSTQKWRKDIDDIFEDDKSPE